MRILCRQIEKRRERFVIRISSWASVLRSEWIGAVINDAEVAMVVLDGLPEQFGYKIASLDDRAQKFLSVDPVNSRLLSSGGI